MKQDLKFKDFICILEYKKIKSLRLKINKDLQLKLCVPYNYPWALILEFLHKNEAWIYKQKARLEKLSTRVKNDEIEFLGKIYKKRLDPLSAKLSFDKENIIMANEEQLKAFLKIRAQKIFFFYIKKWQGHFDKKITKISIKEMRSLWGSCNHRLAHINLNLKLIHRPLKAIEYVILHELNHLKYPHHQKEFYDNLVRLMPDFRQREFLLKNIFF